MNEHQVLTAFDQLAQALRSSQESQRIAIQQMEERHTQTIATVVEQNRVFLEAETRQRREGAMIDSKAVQTPATFSGKEADWPGWYYKFPSWMAGQFKHGDEILDWVANLGETIATPEAIEEIVVENPEWQNSARVMNAQLHAVLVSLTVMGMDAFSIIKNTTKGDGLDTWRNLNRKFDPHNPVSNMMLLRRILKPNQVGLDHLSASIETWGQDYTHYKDRTKEKLSDSMMKACLQSMCPATLSNHIDVNGA